MKRTDTWKPLGSLTTQIAAKLMERREAELENPAALDPKAESGGSSPPMGGPVTEGTGSNLHMAETIARGGDRVRLGCVQPKRGTDGMGRGEPPPPVRL